MGKFPRRTRESDLKAKLVKLALDQCPNSGQNYMVTVVTSRSGKCYVSLSGSTRARAENELKQKLDWVSTPYPGRDNRDKRQALDRNRVKRGGYGADHGHATDFQPRRAGLTDPDRGQVATRRVAGNAEPFIDTRNRDCAEPKALHAAALAGEKITGMSTIWYGAAANGYLDPLGDPNGTGCSFARPCEYCSVNQELIMRDVETVLNRQKGLEQRPHEI